MIWLAVLAGFVLGLIVGAGVFVLLMHTVEID